MKKLLLIVLMLLSFSCTAESREENPICDCKKVHKFYTYMDNRWILTKTEIEDISDDNCSLNGQFQTVMHNNGASWSIKEDITTECN